MIPNQENGHHERSTPENAFHQSILTICVHGQERQQNRE
jgi:hypothetical protein